MSSSSPKKVFFTGFKKQEAVVPPQPSPAFEIRPPMARLDRIVKIGWALNLGLCVLSAACILLTEPPKRRRDTGATVINDATRSDPETLLQSQNSMQSPANV